MKDKLLQAGLSEEQAGAVMGLFQSDGHGKGDSSGLELSKLKEALAQRDAQIASLKSFEGDAKALKAQVEALQKKNAEDGERFAGELLDAQKRFAVKQALFSGERKPHDIDLAMSQFDFGRISIDDKGHAIGIKEQYEGLLQSKGFLFSDAGGEVVSAPIIQGLNVHPKSNELMIKPGTPETGSIGESIAKRSLLLSGQLPATQL